MRRFNAILSAVILVLFLVHAILGSFQMVGLGGPVKALAWITTALIGVHMVIGIVLTVQTLRVRRKTGVSYPRENALFWARRISGFAIMVLLLFHLTAFSTTVDGATRLVWFDGMKLCTQLLLVAAIAVHVISNVKPLLISFGVKQLKPYAGDLLLVLTVLLLCMAAALIVYWLRWNVW